MIKTTVEQSEHPALHSAAVGWFESPSGASLAQFLLVRHDFHRSLRLVRGVEEGLETLHYSCNVFVGRELDGDCKEMFAIMNAIVNLPRQRVGSFVNTVDHIHGSV